MAYEFDYLVFIGRFQPFHHGHEFVVKEALKLAKQVIMVIGSANAARTLKNPFTFDERADMILRTFQKDGQASRIFCTPIDDTLYNDHQWIANVRHAVHSKVTKPAHIGIIGHTKDDSSYYLSLFPDWGAIELPNFEGISATPLRKKYFEQGDIDEQLPIASQNFLSNFQHTQHYQHLHNHHKEIQAVKEAWKNAPHLPIFNTTDALVVQSGHVLLTTRDVGGNELWALPGGLLTQDERLLSCALRKLQEQTGLVIDNQNPKCHQVFDAPDRLPQSRIISHVFQFELTADKLPKVFNLNDDATPFWLPLNEINGANMYGDHHSIIVKMLGL
ncbi:bifunctional nicotinamide-nucleotide adenylyltransferase/Nudix hydroxylase [Moraxella oculi]|uniref:Bifunctional nicotinamide-nucleotide adenylyltransferase/Nudix hydroxylase n=1 Tax=Moraxella oculi TaxID=2940516 RepID=A0ABW8U7H4_9GAMM